MVEAFSIDAHNPYFRVDQDCLIELGTQKLVHCFNRRPKFAIPSNVEVIGRGAFFELGVGLSVFAVDFPANSRAVRIEAYAFQRSGLVALTLPKDVAFIDARAFDDCHFHSFGIASGNRRFEMRSGFLVQVPEQRIIRYFGPDHDIVVPDDILILGPFCFGNCSNCTSISFGDGSNLNEIEHCAMVATQLLSFRIPALVSKIHGSAFGGSTNHSIRVDGRNCHFCINGDFLLDSEGRKLIRYFGRSSYVRIDDRIKVLAAGCFYAHQHLVHCDFCEGSELQSVRERAFWKSPILDITLPGRVCEIEGKAFQDTCHVSIRDLSPDKAVRFEEWKVRHQTDPSVVLNLNLSE
jgi:hypothetical protein